eukprot:TRINITY_DN4805_c0_g1_i1.p1 TRINITY_DN4805_c0_g1~~TRINITY_DN4805_c0_g1_i1.p1  ORF type:complete len:514 (-),score=206.17 TRINITY_DN4805_c0_g1_i1:99-1640(-)
MTDVLGDLETQLAGFMNDPTDRQLRDEIETWKERATVAEERVQTLEGKLKKLVLAIKEERLLQQANTDELLDRAAAAEERSASLETKLMKLVQLVRKEKAEKAKIDSENASAVNGSTGSGELEQKLNIAIQRAVTAEGKAFTFEEAYQQQSARLDELEEQTRIFMGDNEMLSNEISQLRSELSIQTDESQKAQRAYEQLQASASRKENDFKSNINLLEAQINQMKTKTESLTELLQKERSRVQSSASTSEEVKELIERAEEAEAISSQYQSKLTRLIEAIKNERKLVKEQMEETADNLQQMETRALNAEQQLKNNKSQPASDPQQEKKIKELERQLRESQFQADAAERRADRLERDLVNAQSMSSISSTTDMMNAIEEEIGGPPPPPGAPPPPPPPPPNFKQIDSSKLTISKTGSVSGNAPSSAPSSRIGNTGALIDEIKKGVQLKPTTPQQKRPPAKAAGIDMGNLGAMASELAKQRQARMKGKQTEPPPRKKRESLALNKLLLELDSLDSL